MNTKIVNITNCRFIPSNIFIAFEIKANAKIIKIVENEMPEDLKNINIVLCDNNLMLVLQTLNRVGGIPLLENHLNL